MYLARQPELERVVALKVIDPAREGDAGLRARFQRESRIAASIDHPHVLPIYEAGRGRRRALPGHALRRRHRPAHACCATGELAPERALALATQIAGALDAAHARGLVHRDVKPANILLAGGTPEHAYLTDFGVAKRTATATDLTRQGALIGSVDYVPPEQIEGRELGPAADVYALGATLFHMLAGRPPHEGDSDAAVLQAHLTAAPPALRELRPELPELLDGVLARAMAREAADRYKSAGDFAKDLATVLAPVRSAPARTAGGATVVPAGDGAPCPSCGAQTTAGARFCATCGTPIAAQPARETRRLVSAVRVELSGTTVLGDDIDPERRRLLVARARERVIGALEAHGATVRDEGRDAITGLFGVAGVREDDALRAVRAAMEVGERIEAMNAELGAPRACRRPNGRGHRRGRRRRRRGRRGRRSRARSSPVRRGSRSRPRRTRCCSARHRDAQVREAVVAGAPRVRGGGGGRARRRGALTRRGRRGDPTQGRGPTVGRDREIDQLRDSSSSVPSRSSARLSSRVLGPPGIGKSRLASVFAASIDGEALACSRAVAPFYGAGSGFGPCWTSSTSRRRGAGRADSAGGVGGGERRRAGRAADRRRLGSAPTPATRPHGRSAALRGARRGGADGHRSSRTSTGPSRRCSTSSNSVADEVRDLPLVLVCLSRARAAGRAPDLGGRDVQRDHDHARSSDARPERAARRGARLRRRARRGAPRADRPDRRGQPARSSSRPSPSCATAAMRPAARACQPRSRACSRPAWTGSRPRTARCSRAPRSSGASSRAQRSCAHARGGARGARRAPARAGAARADQRPAQGAARRDRELRFGHALIRDTAYARAAQAGALRPAPGPRVLARGLRRRGRGRTRRGARLPPRARVRVPDRGGRGRRHRPRARRRREVHGCSAAGQRAVARDDLQSGVGLLRPRRRSARGTSAARVGLLAESRPRWSPSARSRRSTGVLREIVRVADPTPADPLDALARTVGPGASERRQIDAAIEMATEAARVFRRLGDDRHLGQILLVAGDLHSLYGRATPAQRRVRGGTAARARLPGRSRPRRP